MLFVGLLFDLLHKGLKRFLLQLPILKLKFIDC